MALYEALVEGRGFKIDITSNSKTGFFTTVFFETNSISKVKYHIRKNILERLEVELFPEIKSSNENAYLVIQELYEIHEDSDVQNKGFTFYNSPLQDKIVDYLRIKTNFIFCNKDKFVYLE